MGEVAQNLPMHLGVVALVYKDDQLAMKAAPFMYSSSLDSSYYVYHRLTLSCL